eukprot:scaffold69_cov198-Alexandrium_tamarense.AAC.55
MDLSAVLERSVKARKVTAQKSRTNGASSICEDQGGATMQISVTSLRGSGRSAVTSPAQLHCKSEKC